MKSNFQNFFIAEIMKEKEQFYYMKRKLNYIIKLT